MDTDCDDLLAPPFSPLSSLCSDEEDRSEEEDEEGGEENEGEDEEEEEEEEGGNEEMEEVEGEGVGEEVEEMEAGEEGTVEKTHDENRQEEESVLNNTSSPKFQKEGGPLPTFTIVGDNIDKSIKPRYTRTSHGNRQLHYFHFFAVQDRVDLSHLSITAPPPPKKTPSECARSLLPSTDDDRKIKENVVTIVSRILAKHLESLGFDCAKLVQWRIPHRYEMEMSRKSEVVCALAMMTAILCLLSIIARCHLE